MSTNSEKIPTPAEIDIFEFAERGGQTELVLTHERFASAEARDAHDKGWVGCLDRLGKYVS